MPLNTIEYAAILQTKLDQNMVAASTSGWMEANAGEVIYNGGSTVKIPTIELSGLKDYDRDNGYKQGSVTLGYQTMDMNMDRGTKFNLDAIDVNESNFIASASNVTRVFQEEKVVPEVDAYRYSGIASICSDYSREVTITDDNIYAELLDDIAYVQDIVGYNVPLVVCINGLVKAKLEKLKEFRTSVDVATFTNGTISTRVKTINECPLLPVPSSRMKTSYLFNDGETEGQEAGGFTASADAKNLNWIVMPQKAPIAISKQDKMKIFTPDVNQTMDSWLITYRKYHDVWVKKNMRNAVRTNIQKAAV